MLCKKKMKVKKMNKSILKTRNRNGNEVYDTRTFPQSRDQFTNAKRSKGLIVHGHLN